MPTDKCSDMSEGPELNVINIGGKKSRSVINQMVSNPSIIFHSLKLIILSIKNIKILKLYALH